MRPSPARVASATLGSLLLLSACTSGPVAPATGSSGGVASPAVSIEGGTPGSTQRPASTPTVPAFPLLGSLPVAYLDPPTAARLQGVLDRLVADGAPDAIASVITSKGVWAGAAGIDGPHGRNAQPTDEFNIASVTKVVLAATALRLVDAGTIDLDAPIDRYVPELAAVANHATIRQALAMRSGLGDTAASTLEQAARDCGHAWTREEIVASFPEPRTAPGVAYQYSNPAFKLVGFAMEAAAKRPLADLLGDTVGTGDAPRLLLQGQGAVTPKPWALPLANHEGGVPLEQYGTGVALPCLSVETLALGGSGMASDVPTLARWAWRLFAGQHITEPSLRAMTDLAAGQGHGLGIERLGGYGADIAYGHGGSQAGYGSFLAILPARGVVAVLFINDGASDTETEIRDLVEAAA